MLILALALCTGCGSDASSAPADDAATDVTVQALTVSLPGAWSLAGDTYAEAHSHATADPFFVEEYFGTNDATSEAKEPDRINILASDYETVDMDYDTFDSSLAGGKKLWKYIKGETVDNKVLGKSYFGYVKSKDPKMYEGWVMFEVDNIGYTAHILAANEDDMVAYGNAILETAKISEIKPTEEAEDTEATAE